MLHASRPRSAPLVAPFGPPGLVCGRPAGCARNPVTGKSELSLVSESQEIQMGQQAPRKWPRPSASSRTRGSVLRCRYRQADGGQVGAPQPALGVPCGERRLGERVRDSGRLHLRDPRADELHQYRGGAGYRAGTRDRPRHRPAFGATDQQGPARQLGLGVGSILSSDIAKFGQLARGCSLLFLKYGRDAENQADESGFRYALGRTTTCEKCPKFPDS